MMRLARCTSKDPASCAGLRAECRNKIWVHQLCNNTCHGRPECPLEPREANSTEVAVLHIPKTGGTALISAYAHCGLFMYAHVSKSKGNTRCDNRRATFVTIREPYERLFSAFSYFKYGSQLFHRRSYRANTDMSFEQFVNAWANPNAEHHEEAHRITSSLPGKSTGWVWADHFKAQTEWADSSCSSLRVLCYSPQLIANFRQELLRHGGIDCEPKMSRTLPGQPAYVVNPTIQNNESRVPLAHLPDQTRHFLQDRYGQDLALYRTHCRTASNLPRTFISRDAGA